MVGRPNRSRSNWIWLVHVNFTFHVFISTSHTQTPKKKRTSHCGGSQKHMRLIYLISNSQFINFTCEILQFIFAQFIMFLRFANRVSLWKMLSCKSAVCKKEPQRTKEQKWKQKFCNFWPKFSTNLFVFRRFAVVVCRYVCYQSRNFGRGESWNVAKKYLMAKR